MHSFSKMNSKEIEKLLGNSIADHIRERNKRIAFLYLYAMVSCHWNLREVMEFFTIRIDRIDKTDTNTPAIEEEITLVPRKDKGNVTNEDEQSQANQIMSEIAKIIQL